MKLTLKRVALRDNYTIGKLYIDNELFCDVLEDKVRDLNKDGDLLDKDENKVDGETAIPYGTYDIEITFSKRFQKMLPILLNVPHFSGIRIHGGNRAKDTHGCLLVGKNTNVGMITNSQATLEELMKIISKEKNLKIEIL
jgi:hypothetical protein